MPYSEIIWQQDWTKIQGFVIKSPFSGQILPVEMHPEPRFSQNILPKSLCGKLEQGIFYAPFNSHFTTQLDTERRLCFMHRSGLTLTLELPVALRKLNGKGMHWLIQPNQDVKAGTAILQLDLPFLQLAVQELFCVVTLSLPVELDKIYSRRAKVSANQDPIFVLQFTP